MAQPRNKAAPWGPIILVIAALVLGGIVIVAWPEDDTLIEQVGDGIEDAGDEVGDASRDAVDAVEDAVDDLTDPP